MGTTLEGRRVVSRRSSNRPLQRAELRVTRLAERLQAAGRSAGSLNG